MYISCYPCNASKFDSHIYYNLTHVTVVFQFVNIYLIFKNLLKTYFDLIVCNNDCCELSLDVTVYSVVRFELLQTHHAQFVCKQMTIICECHVN